MQIYITNLPSFYKINLYNEVAKKRAILVLFTGRDGDDRNEDFYNGQINFPFKFIQGNTIQRLISILSLLKTLNYNEVVLGGWDSIECWAALLFSPIYKTSVVVESSIFESHTTRLKGLLKRFFLSNTSKVYASGISQIELIRKLGYNGKVIKTKGVGLFNIISQPKYVCRTTIKNFLYVGRLVKVKNLEWLIRKFNNLPQFTLTIIGFGVEEENLKAIANKNIKFLGAIDNKLLCEYYQSADVFILPSISEPWGLVIEEALNNGTPVMVSNMVGCALDVVTNDVGVIFSLKSPLDFEDKLQIITNVENYNRMRLNISRMDFNQIADYQVSCYLSK